MEANKHIEIPSSTLAAWQEIVDIMADIVEVPAGLIMRLNDPNIEVLLASDSEGNPYHPGDKEFFENSGLYCETVVTSRDKLLVPNALKDPDWENNPDVKLNMISYLGFPLLYPDGTPFGTICILDSKENAYSLKFERLLQKFRRLIQSDLEVIHVNRTLGDENRKISDYLKEIQAFRGFVTMCANCKSIRDDNDEWQPIENFLINHPAADFSHTICPVCMRKLYPDYCDREG